MKKIIGILLVLFAVVGGVIFFTEKKGLNDNQDLANEEVENHDDSQRNGRSKSPIGLSNSDNKGDVIKFPRSRDATETTILALKPQEDEVFLVNQSKNSADGKFWNKDRTHNLKKVSVWYDLHNDNGDLIRRLLRYINVDPTASVANTDHMANDIQWRWLNDNHVIGVQEINYRDSQVLKKEDHECIPGKSCCTELITPDAARIYILDLRAENEVYEVELPQSPAGLTIRLDGINDKGYLSLSAVSPINYHQNKMNDNPLRYKELGVFEVEGLVD